MLPGIAAAAPARVVSLNPCVDSILMHVADPGQIAAISHYSHDPKATSIPLGQARRFRATYGTAEEVIALRTDLVIAGRSDEHTSELQSLMRISYAVFCL